MRKGDKEYYINNVSESAPVFHQPFWLDLVAPGWDVVCIEKGGELIASMPYWIVGKKIKMPPLTQFLGPHIPKRKELKLSEEHKLLSQLKDELPVFDRFEQRWQYIYNNWLPYYWDDYRQTTKYTYVINDVSDEEVMWEKVRSSTRSDIKKARKQGVKIVTGLGFEPFYQLIQGTFVKQGLALPYSKELLQKLTSGCIESNVGEILYAIDETGTPMAASFLAWDNYSTYYILSGIDDAYKRTGASSFLMWESVLFGSERAPSFDFEGSMIQRIETFFRSFGAEQRGYFEVSKNASRNLKIKAALSELKRALKNG